MVITLELPVQPRHSFRQPHEPLAAYTKRFGALPPWLEELATPLANALVNGALRRGEPLNPADCLACAW